MRRGGAFVTHGPARSTLAVSTYPAHSRHLQLLRHAGSGCQTTPRATYVLVGDGGSVRTTLSDGGAVAQSPARCAGGIPRRVTAVSLLVGVGSSHHERTGLSGKIRCVSALCRLA